MRRVSQILPTKVEWLEISSNRRVRKLQLILALERDGTAQTCAETREADIRESSCQIVTQSGQVKSESCTSEVIVHKTIFPFRKTGFNLTSTDKLPVIEQLGHKVVLLRSSQSPMNIRTSESCCSSRCDSGDKC